MSYQPDTDGLKFFPPGIADENHVGGAGNLYLAPYLSIPASPFAGGFNIEGATIKLTARKSADFDPKDYHWGLLVCAKLPTNFADPYVPLQVTNWFYKGVNWSDLLTTTMATHEHVVSADPKFWTYMGVNGGIQFEYAERYAFLDLATTLANVDTTLHFPFLGARIDYGPTGTFVYDSVEVEPV